MFSFNVFADTADNFIKIFSLHCHGPVHKKNFYNSFSVFSGFFCLHARYDATVIAVFCFYVCFLYLASFLLLRVDIFALIIYYLDNIILYVHEIILFLIFHHLFNYLLKLIECKCQVCVCVMCYTVKSECWVPIKLV